MTRVRDRKTETEKVCSCFSVTRPCLTGEKLTNPDSLLILLDDASASCCELLNAGELLPRELILSNVCCSALELHSPDSWKLPFTSASCFHLTEQEIYC